MFGNKKKTQESEYDMVLLKNTGTNYEYAILSGLLEEHGIPFIAQDKGGGGPMRIYTGGSVFGTDFLVSREAYEKAKELVDSIDWEEEQ